MTYLCNVKTILLPTRYNESRNADIGVGYHFDKRCGFSFFNLKKSTKVKTIMVIAKLFYNEIETREALGIKDPATLRKIDKYLQPLRNERNVRIYQVSKLESRYMAYLKSLGK